MLFLEELTLWNYRNYADVNIIPCKGVNCFTGLNGSGKTNLLDAIFYLSMCRSYLFNSDQQNVRFEEDSFLIKGTFRKQKKTEQITVAYKKGERKKMSRNGADYERLSDHIGLVPVVIISPYDVDLINLGSEERRKFLDSIISQFDHDYLNDLIQYNKALAQRNALIKQMNQQGRWQADLLEMYDVQLISYGDRIFNKRTLFIRQFIPVFQADFGLIAAAFEKVNMDHISHLIGSDMAEQLKMGAEKDRIVGYTTRGIHKDDIEFTIMDMPIRRFGSQGQQKSMLLALRTAQAGYIRRETGLNPILLLDDIFDKLDNDRIRNLVDLVDEEGQFDQVFITDTDGQRMKEALKNIRKELRMFTVEKGKVNAQEEK